MSLTFSSSGVFSGSAFAIGDLNGDGKPDLVTAWDNNSVLTVSVLLNSGNGTFQQQDTIYPNAVIPHSVALGDLNGDGLPDLAITDVLDSTVSVFFGGPGSGGTYAFGLSNSYSTGASPQSVAIGDITGDRNPDLVTANAGANTVSVFPRPPPNRLQYSAASHFYRG